MPSAGCASTSSHAPQYTEVYDLIEDKIVAAGYLGAVDRPAEASATSLSRGIVAIVACSLVLSALFGMNGVWAAFPASEAITACLTLFLLKRKN